jgi:DNA polymerase III epsilon subunit-like protein
MIIFDLETGGLNLEHPIIQVAAIAINDSMEEIESFEAKIKFDEASADQKALEINHYDKAVWDKCAIGADAFIASFSLFLKKHADIKMVSAKGYPYYVARLCAYNSAFDAPRIQRLFEGAKAFLPAHRMVYCALQKSMWWFLEKGIPLSNYKLQTVAAHFDIKSDNAHDALSDVRTTLQVLKELNGVKDSGVENASI